MVAGTPQLAHVAPMQGMVAVAKIAGKPATPINRNRIPGATYTEPGIGSVGLTEAQAKAAGYKVRLVSSRSSANSKATILGSHDGFVKSSPTRNTAKFSAFISSDRRPTN